MEWTRDRYCEAVGTEIGRTADVARPLDPEQTVPSTPKWSVADLLKHTGRFHRWVAYLLREQAQRPMMLADEKVGYPERAADCADWFAAGAELLVPQMLAVELEQPIWSWAGDQHASFWLRRALHETTLHRIDIESAATADWQVAESVALDGIGELLDILPYSKSFAQSVTGLRGDGEKLRFATATTSWLVELHPGGFTWAQDGLGTADVTVTATPADLYLLLWGRRQYADPRFILAGNPKVLDHWTANSVV